MKIDPMLTLSMCIHSAPGVHALLLGSGVSRAAGIPTGWEIVLDLARQLAKMQGEEPGADPAAWYIQKYGHEPDYAELLEAVAKTPAERQQLLRAYFEPTEEERSQGLKQPTPAHLAVAKLVARGSVKVILTTNFDHLLERAIEGEGMTPTIVSTADAMDGIMPLIHQRCCIIKLHGDYLDTRILNTPAELAKYPKVMNTMLDRVFDEFGMIFCGWSGRWDTALRAAIKRCKTRRFSWHWMSRGKINEDAERLVRLRGGHGLHIDDADSAFQRLGELVEAVEESRRPAPESMEVAVSLLKRYLHDPLARVRLHDLVIDAAETANEQLWKYTTSAPRPDESGNEDYFANYRNIIVIPEALLIHGCALGDERHYDLWVDTIERTVRFPYESSGQNILPERIHHYPAAHLFYAAGLVALARKKYRLLGDLLVRPMVRARENREARPLLAALYWGEMWNLKVTRNGHFLSLSQELFEFLRIPLNRYLPDSATYGSLFDVFEYIRNLAYLVVSDRKDAWAPPAKHCRHMMMNPEALRKITKQVDTIIFDESSGLLAGLFKGSIQGYGDARKILDNLAHQERCW